MTRSLLPLPILATMIVLGLATPDLVAQPADDNGASAAAAANADAADADDAELAEDEPVTTGRAFLRKLAQGGLTMVVLLLVSIFGVAATIERFMNLRRSKLVPRGLADRVDAMYRQGDFDKARAEAKRSNSTLGRVLDSVVKHRQAGPDRVTVIAGDIASRDLKRHLQRAYPLAVVATLSPLLGLLGTVIGMIGAFDTVAAAGSLGDASMLGGDISKALVTTGAGLAIAVPALALYHYFKSRVNVYGIVLEEQASELIADWFAGETSRPAGAASPTPQPVQTAASKSSGPDIKAQTHITTPNVDAQVESAQSSSRSGSSMRGAEVARAD